MIAENKRLYLYRDSFITRQEYEIDENGEKFWYDNEDRFKQQERRISDKDYKSLKNEIEKVRNLKEVNDIGDSWYTGAEGYVILIGERQHIIVEEKQHEKDFGELIKLIEKVSPIELYIEHKI